MNDTIRWRVPTADSSMRNSFTTTTLTSVTPVSHTLRMARRLPKSMSMMATVPHTMDSEAWTVSEVYSAARFHGIFAQ